MGRRAGETGSRKPENTLRATIQANAALLAAGVLTFVLMGAGQSLYGPALPAFSRMFAISTGQAGLLVSAHWIGCGIGVGGMFFRSAACSRCSRRWCRTMSISRACAVKRMRWRR